MSTKCKRQFYLAIPLVLLWLLGVAGSLYAQTTVKEDLPRAAKWNSFADALYEVHKARIANRDTYTKEENGGYGGVTNNLNYYREVRHYDRKTDRLLSNIKWEKENPDNIHIIELYIYDDRGRIQREYTAAYLPIYRNAPYQTLISIHHYDDDLHSYRQFDASNNRLFEFCLGTHFEKKVHLALDDYEIPDSSGQIRDESERELYQACFGDMPNTAHPYTDPMKEITLLKQVAG